MAHLNHMFHTTACTVAALIMMASNLAAAEPALVIAFSTERLEFGPGDIVEAMAILDQKKRPTAAFRMSPEKARIFGAMTAKHIGEKVDLIVCGKLLSSPMIQSPILGGTGMVSGQFSMDQAKQLASHIKKGTCD